MVWIRVRLLNGLELANDLVSFSLSTRPGRGVQDPRGVKSWYIKSVL
jgi:hypothetical protein